MVLGLGQKIPYTNANILSHIWNIYIYPKGNINWSWFQTCIYKRM
jgi:hypothetical protein